MNPEVQRFWSRAEPLLREALAHSGGTHEIPDLILALAQERLQLWVGEACAGISEVLTFPQHRVLNVFLAAGSAKEIQSLRPGVEAFARAKGCKHVQYWGRVTPALRKRLGWLRFWPDYEPTHVCFSKELS